MRRAAKLSEEVVGHAIVAYVREQLGVSDAEMSVVMGVVERTVGPMEHPAGYSVRAEVTWERSTPE